MLGSGDFFSFALPLVACSLLFACLILSPRPPGGGCAGVVPVRRLRAFVRSACVACPGVGVGDACSVLVRLSSSCLCLLAVRGRGVPRVCGCDPSVVAVFLSPRPSPRFACRRAGRLVSARRACLFACPSCGVRFRLRGIWGWRLRSSCFVPCGSLFHRLGCAFSFLLALPFLFAPRPLVAAVFSSLRSPRSCLPPVPHRPHPFRLALPRRWAGRDVVAVSCCGSARLPGRGRRRCLSRDAAAGRLCGGGVGSVLASVCFIGSHRVGVLSVSVVFCFRLVLGPFLFAPCLLRFYGS